MTEPQPLEKSTGKGRPTPKRSDSRQQRRMPVTAPKNRKEAVAFQKAQRKGSRQVQRTALRTGDERNLPARDAGPVRRYVRDLVDARRNAGNYVLFIAFLVVIAGIVGSTVRIVTVALAYAYPALLLWILIDMFVLVRYVQRRVKVAFPAEEVRGLGGYAAMRAFQIRRLRLPPPKVKLGEKVTSVGTRPAG